LAAHEAQAPKQAFDPSSQGIAGETLDVEPAPPAPEESDWTPVPVEALPQATPAPPVTAAPGPGPRPPRLSGASATTSSDQPSAAAHPQLYGAVGVRFAGDLATTFTRAFPQAASADPIWPTVAFGVTSTAELTLVLDEDGHLARSTIGGAPSLALRRGIERTLILLGTSRPFTAHGAVTRMRLTSRVSRDDVHDGLHGDVFALSGGSFSGDVGNAFFALPPASGPGRRVDLELRLLP
ncbi:MAG TPA: hypothetical protein VHV30_14770, partial [Polyangiaceae bacterium]|nr:hypothetical protein [Polyangiaceae bacterium]